MIIRAVYNRSNYFKGGKMKKYVFKRIMMSLATLLVILLVLFVLMDKMPGSPFNDEKLTEAQRALLYAKYGLDQPIIVRFFLYVKNMLTGDLGVSYAINKNFPISSMIKDRLGISILVGLMAMIIGTIIGLILGILSALNHNTWIDNLCSAISVIGVSVPSYVCALLLCYFIAYKLKWFPILYNLKTPFASLVLPAVALSVSPIANIARFTRSEMIDVLGSDYILLIQSKGVKNYKMIIKHALRNTLIPVITVMGPILVNLMTGSSVIEKIFGIPGIGSLMISDNNDNVDEINSILRALGRKAIPMHVNKLRANICKIVRDYPDVVVKFIKNLDVLSNELSDIKIDDPDNYIGRLNSDYWEVGHAYFKENDLKKAEELRGKYPLQEIAKEKVFNRISSDVLGFSKEYSLLLKTYLMAYYGGIDDLEHMTMRDFYNRFDINDDLVLADIDIEKRKIKVNKKETNS